jgi:hypothetical protein
MRLRDVQSLTHGLREGFSMAAAALHKYADSLALAKVRWTAATPPTRSCAT